MSVIDVHTHVDYYGESFVTGALAQLTKEMNENISKRSDYSEIQKYVKEGLTPLDAFHLYDIKTPSSNIKHAIKMPLDARPWIYASNESVIELGKRYGEFIYRSNREKEG